MAHEAARKIAVFMMADDQDMRREEWDESAEWEMGECRGGWC